MYTKAARRIINVSLLFTFIVLTGLSAHLYASQESGHPAQDIPADVSCGKCGMMPANYPQWQSQVVFSDGSMTPFDGCKCMFGFMFNMGEYDTAHKAGDIAKVWVKDFNTGEWTEADQATYVVGSDEMGPMGKELIPFAQADAAAEFQKAHGGELAQYQTISMATLKPLMGKMDMKKGMGMNGQMDAMQDKKMDGNMGK